MVTNNELAQKVHEAKEKHGQLHHFVDSMVIEINGVKSQLDHFLDTIETILIRILPRLLLGIVCQ